VGLRKERVERGLGLCLERRDEAGLGHRQLHAIARGLRGDVPVRCAVPIENSDGDEGARARLAERTGDVLPSAISMHAATSMAAISMAAVPVDKVGVLVDLPPIASRAARVRSGEDNGLEGRT
jgi:hypothetical protein